MNDLIFIGGILLGFIVVCPILYALYRNQRNQRIDSVADDRLDYERMIAEKKEIQNGEW